MHEVALGGCMRMVGAQVLVDGRRDMEFRQFVQQAWKQVPREAPLVAREGALRQKLQASGLPFLPTVWWTAGARTELRQVRSMQTRMARRILGWWPRRAAIIRTTYYSPSGALVA